MGLNLGWGVPYTSEKRHDTLAISTCPSLGWYLSCFLWQLFIPSLMIVSSLYLWEVLQRHRFDDWSEGSPSPDLRWHWFFTALYSGQMANHDREKGPCHQRHSDVRVYTVRCQGLLGVVGRGCCIRVGSQQAFKLKSLNFVNFGPVSPVRSAWGKCSWIFLTFGFPVSRSALTVLCVCVFILIQLTFPY